VAPPQVDLTDLQNVIGQYMDQHGFVVAAGPLAGAAFVRMFISKSKLATTAVVGSGAWLAVQSISTPMLRLMQEQFGYLQSLLGG
jgi:hypothetical protein